MNKNILSFLIICLMGFSRAGYAFPQRIISLAPSITESLYELDAGDRIVGVTVYCNRPEDAKKKEKIGNLQEINTEKIVSLKPDIVFASKDDNRPEAVAKLRKLGITVFVFDSEVDFKTVCLHFRKLGEIVGAGTKAGKILKDIDARMEKIKKKLIGLLPLKVFCQLGANPVVTAGKGTFIDEFIRLSGGTNIAHNIPNRYAWYSAEQVIKDNPDIIIITTMGEGTEKEKENWDRFKRLSAVKNNRIYLVNADLVCRPAPTVLIQGFEEVARCIHPEAFK